MTVIEIMNGVGIRVFRMNYSASYVQLMIDEAIRRDAFVILEDSTGNDVYINPGYIVQFYEVENE